MRCLAVISVLMLTAQIAYATGSNRFACSGLFSDQAPVPAALTTQEIRSIRTEIAAGAVQARSSLMLQAWKVSKEGFLVERTDFDYDSFILGQIRNGVDINDRDPNGRTALMHAASSGFSRMIWSLLKFGANVDLKDKDGQTAADLSMRLRTHASVKTDLFYVQKYLSYRGYYIADQVREHFNKRNFQQLETLFNKGVYVDTFDLMVGKSLLTYAAEKNDLEMIRFLLKHRANPNFGNRDSDHNHYPVIAAAALCHKDAISLLLKHGADLNARGSSNYDINPVRQAIWDYAFEANDKLPKLAMLEWWLAKGANPNANLEYLGQHQRKSLRSFMDDVYSRPESKTRRARVEAILKAYRVDTGAVPL